MLWTVASVLVVLWLLGLITSYTMNGYIHILFALAIIAAFLQITAGKHTAR
ncbi:MAG: lmo0937 family membrane protein [Phycisphaerae bacterium]